MIRSIATYMTISSDVCSRFEFFRWIVLSFLLLVLLFCGDDSEGKAVMPFQLYKFTAKQPILCTLTSNIHIKVNKGSKHTIKIYGSALLTLSKNGWIKIDVMVVNRIVSAMKYHINVTATTLRSLFCLHHNGNDNDFSKRNRQNETKPSEQEKERES